MGLLDGIVNRIFKGDAAGDDAADEANLVPATKAIRFVGATVTHVPGKRRTDVAFAGGEGGGTPSDTTPAAVDASAAAAGVATSYSRGDHKHAVTNGSLALTKLADIPYQRIVGRFTAGAGAPEALTPAQVWSNINAASLEDTGTPANIGTAALGVAAKAARSDHVHAIADGALAIAKLANIATARFLGRTTAGSGAVEELTATQATAMLGEATTSLKGLLSAAFWQLLDGATAAATASRLMLRDANADVAVRRLTVADQVISTGALAVVPGGALTLGTTSQDLNLNCFSLTASVATSDAVFYCNTRRFVISDYGAASQIIARPMGDVAVASMTASVAFSVTPSASRVCHYMARLSQQIGDDEIVHWFQFSGRRIGGVARLTAGAPPIGVYESTPAVAGFQAAVLESGGATIDFWTERDTASSVTETLDLWEMR